MRHLRRGWARLPARRGWARLPARRGWARLPARRGMVFAVTGILVAVLSLTLPGQRLGTGLARLAGAAPTLSRRAASALEIRVRARLFPGTPAVGALFQVLSGRIIRHFCTAAVVDSPAGNLLITAAHCVSGSRPGRLAFVPGYHDGRAPYGVWLVTRVFVDSQWLRTENPGHDVAFLTVRRAGSGAGPAIQQVTGGERLGTGWPSRAWVQVIGYPSAGRQPVTCRNRTRPLGRGQLEFTCAGYTDGTSGGPFLARVRAATGDGTVIGVIGGYEQGGDLAAVSYSPRFGRAVRALYRAAASSG
jgi:V8-like Glu-specific endopeptidase